MSLPADLRARLVLPAMSAPTFLCSGADMVAEVCKAGLIGSLTRNHCRTDAELEAQLEQVADAVAGLSRPGPLAVNISLHMEPAQMASLVAMCARHGVSIVITAAGNPKVMTELVHAAGMRVFHDVTSVAFASKAIAAGVDGLIAIGAGGGGHSGTISHLALIPQLRAMFDGVIVMAGAVSTGAVIRAAEVLGADLAYLGTRFIATRESMAPDHYKAMLVSEDAGDVLYTGFVNGTPANWLRASLRENGLDPDDLPRPEGRGSGHLPPAVQPWKTLFSAGQGIGLIHDVPTVAELVQRLQREYAAACRVPAMAARVPA